MNKLKAIVAVTLAIMLISGLMVDLKPVYSQANTEYVTLNTQGAGTNLREVVKMIARQAGVNIILDRNVTGKVALSLKDVYFEKALELIAKTNGLSIRKEGNTYIVGKAKDLAEGFDRGLTRTFRLNFAKPETVQKVVGDVFKTTTGIPVKVSIDTRINAIIVQGTKDQLDQVESLVKDLDVKVHQVLIEAKIVEVKTDGEKKLGFNWGWTTGAAGDGNHVITGEDAGGNGSIFSVSEYQSKMDNQTSYNPTVGDESGANELFEFGDFFRGKFLFEATFNALESTGNSKILSNPKIATLNGQKAHIEIGSKIVYQTGGDQGAAEKDVGIKLEITPQINDEGWITTEISPSVTFLETYKENLPIIGRRIANTMVRVKDGEEILIGGLIAENTTKSKTKFPILGNIPLLKTFFTNTTDTDSSQQLIILVKPSIVPEVES
jgi:type IV pilus assembly protein PilQ